MSDYLTTRQTQDLLKVDRITIYRMLQDGRLKGVKIGHQWRFTRREVERLLNGESIAVEAISPTSAETPSNLPVHCLQTVQNLFSSVSQVGSLMTSMDGTPITQVSGMCQFCRLVNSVESGTRACQQSWQMMARRAAAGERRFTCHAGLEYLASPVMDGDNPLGWMLIGQVFMGQPSPEYQLAQLGSLTAAHALPSSDVQQAAAVVAVVPEEKQALLKQWAISASQTVESILQERTGFMQRLQKIANLTQV